LLHARLDQIRRAAIDRLLIPDDLIPGSGVDLCRRPAIVAPEVILYLFRNDLVASSENDIEGRLSSDDLARGGYQRRVAHLLAYPGDFRENIHVFLFGALLAQLGDEVGEHAARDLEFENIHIDTSHAALETYILFPDISEIARNLRQACQVQTGVALGPVEGAYQRFGRCLGCDQRQGGDGGVDNVDTSFSTLE